MERYEKLPKLKDRKIFEKEITKDIRDYLKLKEIFHYKQWQGLGSLHGISDIIGILNGRYLAIEVKRAGKNPSDKQQAFLNRVNAEGGIGFIAHSVEDVIVQLRAYGIQDYSRIIGRRTQNE